METFRILERANDSPEGTEDHVLFRITTTELEGNPQVLEVEVSWSGSLANPEMTCVNKSSLSYDTLRGLSQIRCNYPKALGNGKPWHIEASATDRAERTVKVEVIEDSESVVWMDERTPSGYVSDYNSAVLDVPEATGSMSPDEIEGLMDLLDEKADKDELSRVAFSGSYEDLDDIPMINGIELIGDKSFPELDLLRITNTELEEMLT